MNKILISVLIGSFLLLNRKKVKKTTDDLISFLGNAKVSRCFKNNNPGNIKVSKREYLGKIPLDKNTDKIHEQFTSFEHGLLAMIQHLNERYIKGGLGRGSLNTISKILYVYAPTSENDTEAYIRFVVKQSGIGRDSILQPYDKETFRKLTFAMCQMECGTQYIPNFFLIDNWNALFNRTWKMLNK